jgi:hypothetical protein
MIFQEQKGQLQQNLELIQNTHFCVIFTNPFPASLPIDNHHLNIFQGLADVWASVDHCLLNLESSGGGSRHRSMFD